MQYPDTGRTVDQELSNNIATIGENMNIRRLEILKVSNGVIISYVHNSVADGLGKLGVLVALESNADKDKLSVVG